MANDGFNGATLAFGAGGSVGDIRSIGVSVGGAVIDLGASDDTAVLSRTGRDDYEITMEVVGCTTLSRGDTGTLTVTWNDAGSTTETLTLAIVTQIDTNGSMDGEITQTVTFKEAQAA